MLSLPLFFKRRDMSKNRIKEVSGNNSDKKPITQAVAERVEKKPLEATPVNTHTQIEVIKGNIPEVTIKLLAMISSGVNQLLNEVRKITAEIEKDKKNG